MPSMHSAFVPVLPSHQSASSLSRQSKTETRPGVGVAWARFVGVIGVGVALGTLACSGKDAIADQDDPAVEEDAGPEDDDTETNPLFAMLGYGDPDRVTLTELYAAPSNLFCEAQTRSCPGLAADLEFNPAREGELWVVFRQPYAGEPCLKAGDAGCLLLGGKVAILQDATSNSPTAETKEDGNSWHFMRQATSLAFADDDTFATVAEARTGNFLNDTLDYMGPTWWSADPDIFAQEFMLNGSHLDMLHSTPYGMGIAHQRDAVFWAFNGAEGSLDRYDFHEPHEPGGAYHGDAEYDRYVRGQVKRQENVPSHMAFGSDGTTLYVADSGNQRVVALDTTSGENRVSITTYDGLADPGEYQDADLVELVPKGVMLLPSGLDVFDDHLFVTDAQTSKIHLFDDQGEELLVLDTGLPNTSLAGLSVGPDEKVYIVDWPGARVLRIDVD